MYIAPEERGKICCCSFRLNERCIQIQKGVFNMKILEIAGIKSIKLELKGNYATLEELFEAMKPLTFEAGVPKLKKNIIGFVIAFPPVDRNNQVWITGSQGKFNIARSAEVVGLGNLAKNYALSTLSGGWSRTSGVIGKNKKRCMELVDITARELKEAGI